MPIESRHGILENLKNLEKAFKNLEKPGLAGAIGMSVAKKFRFY